MDIDMTNDGKFNIGMQEYINEAIEIFDEDVSTPVASAAYVNLTNIQESESLYEQESDMFHSFVAKLLWVEKRMRPNINTSIYLLCNRVLNTTTDNNNNIKHLIQFLN